MRAKGARAGPLDQEMFEIRPNRVDIEAKGKIHLANALGPAQAGGLHVRAQVDGHLEGLAKGKVGLVAMLARGARLGDRQSLMDKSQGVALAGKSFPMPLVKPALVLAGEHDRKATKSNLATANQGKIGLGDDECLLALEKGAVNAEPVLVRAHEVGHPEDEGLLLDAIESE